MNDSAVTIIDPLTSIQVNLDQWPEERFNRLIPTQTIRMPSDLFVPVVQVVQLEPADREGKSPDHYSSRDVPPNHRAPTARGINKLVSAAGVSFFDERRLDDGTDPDVMGVTVMAAMLLPTGQRVTAPGSQVINLKTWFGSQTSDAEKAKFRKQFYAHVSTRARNRAARAILSLRASYPDREIAKPFAVVSYAPNLNHPAVQARFIDAMVPALDAGYGPSREAPAQLVSGPATTVLPEAPEDEGAGEQPSAGDPAASALPSWAQRSAEPTETKAAAKPLTEILGDSAAASDLRGGVTAQQEKALEKLMAGLDWDTEIVPVLAGAFSESAARSLTAGQAAAIITVANSFDTPAAFAEAWRAAVGPAAD
jgi:hypothetical protein